jgi:uncharacterized protein
MERDDEALPARAVPGGIAIYARVTPKASADEVLGVERHNGGLVLKIKVRAAPDKGEANAAVVALLAKWLSEPKARLKVAAGAKARLKQVVVEGDPPALMAKLAARLVR